MTLNKTYLFYDIETTGLNKCFDQVLQFAAIRTDLDFNELSRHEIKVRLNPDVIPSPYALATHQINCFSQEDALCEYEAIKKIHVLMNEPGTISLGYNTLKFDDEFLRFSFYRNLLPAYTHQYANQCCRMDIYPITLMYYLYHQEVIQWPETDNGKTSLKLENINAANQFVEGQAHDAMVDVLATLTLAKQLARKKDIWHYLLGFFNKNTDQARQIKLPYTLHECREGILISSDLGYSNAFQAPVLGLGQHQHYKNQTLWLRLDKPELQRSKKEAFQQNTWTINKKLGENVFILPPTERFLSKIDKVRLDIVHENKQWLRSHPEILKNIARYYTQYTYPETPQTDLDAALYLQGFWNDSDHADCQSFHQALHKGEAINIISNPHLKQLALRIVGRNFPEQLNNEQAATFETHMEKCFSDQPPIDFKGNPRYSKYQLARDIEKLASKPLNQTQQQLINKLASHFQIN